MDLKNLTTFIHVAQLGSFTKAGQVLGCSQSTISFQIRQLEDELDFESMKKQDLITYIHQIIDSQKDKTTVIFENKPTKNDVHPTMKPVALIGKLMKNSSKPEWNVLDLFGGSGSTLMAAEQLNRTAFLMELDEKFCDVIVRRWENYTGGKAVRKSIGQDLEL